MIIGHQKQWELLKKSFEISKIPHAYLFCGEKSIGKKKVALEFIKLINCKNGGPCQKCRDCQDFDKNTHPDFFLIGPEEFSNDNSSVGKKEIKIGQIKELHSRLALRSYSAPFKSVIVDQAHLLNQEAQSAFLKLLEEPKGKTVFILISEFPDMLLQTILSRVEVVKFYPVAQKEIEGFLKIKNISKEDAKKISSFSMGKPGRAISFISDPKKREFQRKKTEEIAKISRSDIASKFQYAKKLSEDPKRLTEILEIWMRYFREILISKAKDEKSFSQYSLLKMRKIIKLVQTINFLISTTNVSPKLALEILMLEV
ncbi:MAG: DNA polymerase III subunit delta' [Candidatus Nealsonbacteria bacterium]